MTSPRTLADGPTLPSGAVMPLLGLGTWRLEGAGAQEAVETALAAGYRHLDTATMYRNEEAVGAGIRASGVAREEVFVTTKLPPGNAGDERATIERSLEALGLEQVDLWLIHWPPDGPGVPTWEAFRAARDAGLARDIGVSNYDAAGLDALADATGERPAVNQVKWAPAIHDPAVARAHSERGVVLEGYSPFKAGSLDDPVLAEVAAAHGVGPAQVVVRWHLQHGYVVIPRSSRPERVRSNADVLGFALDDEEMARIDGLGRA